MDSRWIYGSEPENIFATIMQGRPNGMPAFGGRIPDDQLWQLVAYVRSLSGQTPQDAASSHETGAQPFAAIAVSDGQLAGRQDSLHRLQPLIGQV